LSVNTIEENQRRDLLNGLDEVWLFGYGSLIYLVDFPYIESRVASIRGWSRRFWQGSHDHRGSEQNPGRVVTLIEKSDALCGGMAYKVEASVFAQLDVREKNGYLRFATDLIFEDGSSEPGLVYIATPENGAYLGEASDQEIARQICHCKGFSGPNDEYLLELARSLRQIGIEDPHVFALERNILQIMGGGDRY